MPPFIKIPANKVKKYHKYFDGYRHARRFINQMKTYPDANLWVDNVDDPTVLYFGIPWINILAGDHSHPDLDLLLEKVGVPLLIYPDEAWKRVLKDKLGDKLVEHTRMTYKSGRLDLDRVRRLVKDLPEGYCLERVDLETGQNIDGHLHAFSRTWGSVENYVDKGLGYCIRYGDKVVSHAGSIFPYTDDLEIQVDTDPDFRRRGLATVVCARLIEECLLNNITPYWDAHTVVSAGLAEKLGFNDPVKYELFIKS